VSSGWSIRGQYDTHLDGLHCAKGSFSAIPCAASWGPATAGALIAMRSDRPVVWPPSITNALVLEFAALIALALGWHWEGARTLANAGFIEPLIMLSAFAMGVQSAAVRRIGVSAVTSTAVTEFEGAWCYPSGAPKIVG
jgi:uncharacterized membrane protein YoaK (UPF0700 family)